MKTRTMTRTQAELLLAAVIIARSTSYVLTKVGLQDMGKFTLLAVRFLLAFAFLAVLFWRRLLQIDRLTHAGADPLLSGMVQVGFLGVLALIASFLFETPHLPGSGTEWLVVLALALVCSGFGFTLQPVAQSGTTADHAALFCALNPFVAATLGAVCFHEHFGLAGLLGGALILAGILVSCRPQKTGG